jgi:hypothetical protein
MYLAESAVWRLSDIKIPVLSIGHWGKMGLHLRGNILGYEGVSAPKKLVVTGAKNVHEAHHQYDQIEFHEKELLPFYDAHLRTSTTDSWTARRCGSTCEVPMNGARRRNGRCRARLMCRCICAGVSPAA